MKTKGVPFIATKTEAEGSENLFGTPKSGLEVALLGMVSDLSLKGVNISGLYNVSTESFRESRGLNIAGVANSVEGDFLGVNIAGITNLSDYRGCSGVSVAGAINSYRGNCGGLQISGGFNYAGEANRYLIQVSLLGNYIGEVDADATVIQIGIYNKAGNQVCPLFNVKGLKNLFKKRRR